MLFQAEESHLVTYDPIPAGGLLQGSVLGLSFNASKADFTGGVMQLKCTATIETFYLETDEEKIRDTRYFPSTMEKQQRAPGANTG